MGNFKPWRDVADGFMREHERVQADIRDLYEKMNNNAREIAMIKGKMIAYGVMTGTIVSAIGAVLMKLVWG